MFGRAIILALYLSPIHIRVSENMLIKPQSRCIVHSIQI